MAANEYKVKVGVEFNAQMSNINSQIDQLKDKISKMGSATGDKSLAAGLNKDIQEITTRLNGLRDMTITPANFNRFQAELQAVNGLIQKVRGSLNNIDVSNILGKIEEQRTKQTNLNKEIEVQNKLISDLNSKENRTSKDNKQLDEAIQKRKQLTQQLNGHKGAVAKLEKQLQATGLTQEEITRLLEAYGRAMQEAEKDGEKFRQGQEELANSKVADTIQRQVNAYIGFGAIYQYTKRYIRDLIQTYKEFDQSLVAIAAVTGQTRDEMWANIGVYNKMAQSLGVTTQEVINASKLYYQQGLTTTSVLKLTEETVKLATIAELDSAAATEYLTTAMNGFKLSAEESTRVTDVWANLAAKTASDVDELAVAISKVASLAENAGMEIETASAFLNQMIETTREAPENLGTALKTIIARFQELKTSEEELSDGVDANKVERALKSAGVALRDTTGQFRDFDDVILELSSKWDTLDRNTQRYIATIAAGSRQQSRFIALVSDYEGLLRNVNYAYDSLGSADAQMAVFQEGLAASTNRLKAAWEGLYTSWSESATVISKLIDAMADFVSTLADLGAGWSALIAINGIFIARILAAAAASEIRSGSLKKEAKAEKELYLAHLKRILSLTMENNANAAGIPILKQKIAEMEKEIALSGQQTIGAIKNAGAQALVALKYVAVAAAIALVVYGLIKLANYEKDYLKSLEKQKTELQQLAAQEKDRASNAGVLIQELKETNGAEEQVEQVRQKIIDQFGDTIKGIDLERASWKELTKALEDYQKQQNLLAAKDYINAGEFDQQLRLADKGVKEIKGERRYRTSLGSRDFIIEPFFELLYDGKTYSSYDELFEAHPELYEGFDLPLPQRNFIAQSIIDSGQIGKETEISRDIIRTFLESLSREDFKSVITDEGKISEAWEEELREVNTAFNNFYNNLKDDNQKAQIENLLAGNYDTFTNNTINQLISSFQKVNPVIAQRIQTTVAEANSSLNAAINEFGLDPTTYRTFTTNFSFGMRQAAIDAFNNLSQDPADHQAFIDYLTSLVAAGTDSPALMQSFNDLAAGMDAYAAMLNARGNLKDGLDSAVFDQLGESIGFVNRTLEEGLASQENYYKAIADLNSLFSEGMAWDDFYAKVESLVPIMMELTGWTEAQVRAQFDLATITNEAGGYIFEQTEGLKQLADAAFNSSETTVEGKRAELEAYGQTMLTVADAIDAAADEAETRGLTSVEIVTAMQGVSNATAELEAQEIDTGEEAIAMWKRVGSDIDASSIKGAKAAFKDLQQYMSGVVSISEARDIASKVRDLGNTALTAARQLKVTRANVGDYGKAAGKAAKETDKLKDAVKDLKEQLNDAKKSAESYMDLIIEKLEEEKDLAEARIKKREDDLKDEQRRLKLSLKAWRDYIDERNKAQQDELQLQADAAANYYEERIAAQQALIDALDDEADAEDRIFKLQKARDEYNKAQNSRTRLVLTKGAGWIFKTDQNAIAEAQKNLVSTQREIRRSELQDQLDNLEKERDKWQEIANGIGESAIEAERLADATERFAKAMEAGGLYANPDAYQKAVDEQKKLNDIYEEQSKRLDRWEEQAGWDYQDYLDDDYYQEELWGFREGVLGEGYVQGNVESYIKRMLDTQTYVDGQTKIIERLDAEVAAINEQKRLLGLTEEEIELAKQIKDTINSKFRIEEERFGVSIGSDYWNENVLTAVEKMRDLQKKLVDAETKQKAGSGGGSSGGGGGGGGGSLPHSGSQDPDKTVAPPAGYNFADTLAGQAAKVAWQYASTNEGYIPMMNTVARGDHFNTIDHSRIANTNIHVDTIYTQAHDGAGLAADIRRLNYVV